MASTRRAATSIWFFCAHARAALSRAATPASMEMPASSLSMCSGFMFCMADAIFCASSAEIFIPLLALICSSISGDMFFIISAIACGVRVSACKAARQNTLCAPHLLRLWILQLLLHLRHHVRAYASIPVGAHRRQPA